jgi:hypothetical protein
MVILDRAAVQLSPTSVRLLPGVSGDTVTVTIRSSPDAPPGRYVGVVRAENDLTNGVLVVLDLR